MAAPIDFISHRKIDEKRENKRKAQSAILEKAKKKYEDEERREKLRRERGDDRWMLPALSDSLDAAQSSKKKRRKKEKEKKKCKKNKKQKLKERSTEDGSLSSGDGSDGDEAEWVEANPSVAPVIPPKAKVPSINPPEDTHDDIPSSHIEHQNRDSWMESPFLMATYSSSEIRKQREEKRQAEKDKERQSSSIDNSGHSARELNPFWKDGGTGLPEEDPLKGRSQPVRTVGVADRGVGWLRKSYDRVKQQAKEEGRSFEELAIERWGSVEKIHAMLEESEGSRHGRSVDTEKWRRGDQGRRGWRKDGNRRDEDRLRDDNRRSRENPQDERERKYERLSDRKVEKYCDDRDYGSRGFQKPQDNSDDSPPLRGERCKEEDRGGERQRDRREREGDKRSTERSLGSFRGQFRKPGDEETGFSSRQVDSRKSGRGLGSLRGQFRKPGNDGESQSGRDVQSRSGSGGGWKKPGYEKQRSESPPTSKTDRTDGLSSRSSRSSASPSSSSSSSDSSGQEEEEEEGSRLKVLTKDEMNQLGAKIVKAEIMGNQKLVDELKKQLEDARIAGTAQSSRDAMRGSTSKSNSQRQGKDKEQEEVILSRTNRMGQSYPLPEEAGYVEHGKQKRRRKKGVETHGKDGERDRYFGDDDSTDLKTMVRREKMGLAEDQNNMFARAQTSALKSLNEEYTLDDMFVSSANKESDKEDIKRQRDRAIREHQKMEAALSRCPYCIDSPEMQKHLIIALGIKVYLCLPRRRSLTSGHCLIIPMQHSMASTALDEDVWNEIQFFRKGLTKMFDDQGNDSVFLEYSSNGQKQRHMCIECIPVPKDTGELAPIYFKKAIQESETEWSQNKKLIDTRKKDIRHCVPKGFPYFSVDFGLDGGFAHVIEDDQLFVHYFGKEVIGGMLDLEPRSWRNPLKENFEAQRKKVLEFGEWWKPFDWTKKIDRERS